MSPWASGDSLNSTNLNARGGNIYDIRAYGAVGDASTDDRASIQSAINAAPDGSTVIVSNGTFFISSQISVWNRNRLTIQGPGALVFASEITGVDIKDCEMCRIKDLTINGNGGANGGTGVHVRAVDGNNLSTILDNIDVVATKFGVTTSGTGCHDATITGGRLTGSANVTGSVGVQLIAPDNKLENSLVIKGYEQSCVITTGFQQILGTHFYRSPSTTMVSNISCNKAGVVVTGCYFDGFPTDGNVVLDAVNARGFTLTGNVFLSTTTAGPFVKFYAGAPSSGVLDVEITGNIFASGVATKTNGIITDGNVSLNAAQRYRVRNNSWRNATQISNDPTDIQAPSYVSIYTPDPMQGGTIIMSSLTGDVAIANGSNVSRGGYGHQLTFVFTQDAVGGRNVTWGSDYLQRWSDTGNSANSQSVIKFVWNGTAARWVQDGTQGPYV
jgi:hypothetical protein